MKWNQMIPELDVFNLAESLHFYTNIIGFKIVYNRLKNSDYKIFVEMEDHWYRKDNILMGCREFLVQDPNGYLLRFSQDLENMEV